MKQKIGVFLLSALLVVSLSACGQMSSTDNRGIMSDNTTTAERNYRQGTSPNFSTGGDNNGSKKGTDNRQGVLEPKKNALNSDNSNNTNKNTKGGKSADRNGKDEGSFANNGTSYEQMIRNGLVNDTDGDLTDGENPHS